MARYTGPREKIERRIGEKLYLKGDRSYSPKSATVKKPYPPGLHGKKGTRKSSEYGQQLRAKQKVKNVPSVRLIIAYEPSEDAIDRFYSFIVDACQRPVLLDIGYAPDIIGGAVVIYEGKYRDYSFKNIFIKYIYIYSIFYALMI